jgi:hypothetical protein
MNRHHRRGNGNGNVQVIGQSADVAKLLAQLNAAKGNQGCCQGGAQAAQNLAAAGPEGIRALVPVVTGGNGLLAGVSSCLTTGMPIPNCKPGSFPLYTQQAPLFVSKTKRHRDFDIPCASAVFFLSEIADKCASNEGIVVQANVPGSFGCSGTTVSLTTSGGPIPLIITAEPGCEVLVPGLILGFGMSNNTSPGLITIAVSGIDREGCAFEDDGIEVQMTEPGTGYLALIFSCDVNQRNYPTLARLRTDVPLLPSGTSIPTDPPIVLASALNYANESIEVDITAPAGFNLTARTLTWDTPAMACIYASVMDGMTAQGS